MSLTEDVSFLLSKYSRTLLTILEISVVKKKKKSGKGNISVIDQEKLSNLNNKEDMQHKQDLRDL